MLECSFAQTRHYCTAVGTPAVRVVFRTCRLPLKTPSVCSVFALFLDLSDQFQSPPPSMTTVRCNLLFVGMGIVEDGVPDKNFIRKAELVLWTRSLALLHIQPRFAGKR